MYQSQVENQSQMENQENLLSDSLNALQVYFALIEDILEASENKPTVLDELCQVTEDYCRIDFENKKAQQALGEVRRHLDRAAEDQDEGADMDVEELYGQKYAADTSTLGNVRDSEVWCQVFGDDARNDVQEVARETDEPVAYYEEMQDSVMCSTNATFKPTVDPITKQAVRDPCKSKKCRHVYEKESIMQYIRSRKRRAKCPYIGCTYDLTLQDLADDRELKEQTQNYFSTQAASNSESDDLDSE